MLRLQRDSLDWALQHALTVGDTDVFPPAFEYLALKHSWASVLPYLCAIDLHSWAVRPHRFMLAPKAHYGFRTVTQLDPIDFILFTAAIREVGTDIEARRVPIRQNAVFSYRFAPDGNGRLFASGGSYRDFITRSAELLDANPAFTHVAVADIADFYHRIYHHRLENALQTATSKTDHVRAIMRLLSGWNGTETYGLPVGSAPTRVLAEIAIADIDDALLGSGRTYVRYNDDYRILAHSHADGYRHLAFLADTLSRNHGLTLQPQKTTVLPAEEYKSRYLPTPQDMELQQFKDTFEELAKEIGLTSFYDSIDYEDLTAEQQAKVDSLNLHQLFADQLSAASPDMHVIRFVLRRMAQLADASLADTVIDRIDQLYPVFPDVVRYLSGLDSVPGLDRNALGARVLSLLNDSILSELEYHRVWAMELFARGTSWGNGDRIFQMYPYARDEPTRRKLILAMSRSAQRHWFQSQWRSVFDFPHWTRRAVLAGASCLPRDARRHLYRSLEPRLDPLEQAVVDWASANPFS